MHTCHTYTCKGKFFRNREIEEAGGENINSTYNRCLLFAGHLQNVGTAPNNHT